MSVVSPDRPTAGIVPVIMSGGSGSRLWPLSTEQTPKQFHALDGQGRTMLQATALRLSAAPGVELSSPIIVCNRRHEGLVLEQLSDVGVVPDVVVLEPFGRSTAAVAVVAARLAAQRHPGAKVLLAPADHVIADQAGFREAVARAASVDDRIVTFGVQPSAPETGYGYIQAGGPIANGVFEIARFIEKPELRVAQAYLAEGGYYWNGGIFLFPPELLLTEMQAFRSDILSTVSAALEAAPQRGVVRELPDTLFAAAPSESLDVAIMESTRRAAVAPFEAGWADVGSWSELWRLGPRDENENLLRGDAIVVDTSGSLVWSEGMTTGVVGMNEVLVVAVDGAVVVLPKARAQDVRKIAQALADRRGRPSV